AEVIEGARDAVRHARLPSDTLQAYPDAPSEDAYNPVNADAVTYRVAQQAFAAGRVFASLDAADIWGLIAPNDNTAYAVLRAATELGKTVGTDYGLVGFDDDFRSSYAGLTTVRPPVEAMGEEAGRLLLQALQ